MNNAINISPWLNRHPKTSHHLREREPVPYSVPTSAEPVSVGHFGSQFTQSIFSQQTQSEVNKPYPEHLRTVAVFAFKVSQIGMVLDFECNFESVFFYGHAHKLFIKFLRIVLSCTLNLDSLLSEIPVRLCHLKIYDMNYVYIYCK